MMATRRQSELDGLKFIAFLWIALSHLTEFAPFNWNALLTSTIVLRGASGKWGMSIFAVLSGYVCAASVSAKKDACFGVQVINRYLRYFLPLFTMCLVWWIIVLIGNAAPFPFLNTVTPVSHDGFSWMQAYTVRYLFRDTILLGDTCGYTWWVREFFFSSLLLSALLLIPGEKKRMLAVGAAGVMAFLIFRVWAMAILLGGLLYLLYEKGFPLVRLAGKGKWLLVIYVLGAVFCKLPGPESYGVYCGDVLSAIFLLLVVCNAGPVQRVLGLPVLSRPGRASYSMYLVSLPMQYTFTTFAASALIRENRMTTGLWIAISIADIAVVLLVSYALYRFAEQFLYKKLRLPPNALHAAPEISAE